MPRHFLPSSTRACMGAWTSNTPNCMLNPQKGILYRRRERKITQGVWIILLNEQLDHTWLLIIHSYNIVVISCKCGLNENCPHRLIYVNAWFPVGGTFLGRIGRCGLVGGCVPVEMGFGLSKAHAIPSVSLCLLVSLLVSLPLPPGCVSIMSSVTALAQCLNACCHAPCHDGHGV